MSKRKKEKALENRIFQRNFEKEKQESLSEENRVTKHMSLLGRKSKVKFSNFERKCFSIQNMLSQYQSNGKKEQRFLEGIQRFKDLCHMLTFLETTGEQGLSSKTGQNSEERISLNPKTGDPYHRGGAKPGLRMIAMFQIWRAAHPDLSQNKRSYKTQVSRIKG